LGENDTNVTSFGSLGLNGTVYGNAAPTVSGKYGGAYSFDGDGDYIDLGNPSDFAALQVNMTIMGWFNENGASGRPIVIGQYGSTGSHQLVKMIRLDGDKLNYFTSTSSGTFQFKQFSTTYTQNTWHFFAVIVNGSLASPSITLYLDGVAEQSSLSALSTTPDTSVPIWIGRSSADVDTEDFGGQIDEIQIYNRSLSLDEINLAYFSNLQRFNTSLWNFYINQSKNGTAGLDEGTYTYFIAASNSSGGQNQTEQRTITISSDPDSPIWFNNKTSITSTSYGEVYFNITFNETNPDKYIFSFYNGTIWLNQSANYASNTEISLTKNITISSGEIKWTWYANDTHGNTNQTPVQSIHISIGSSSEIPEETPQSSGGRGGNYLIEKNSNSSFLEFRTSVSLNKSMSSNVTNNKNTGIKQIEIKAKNWINGNIYITPYNWAPENCQIDYEENYVLYKALDINSTFNSSLISDARVRVGISKDWIYDNNISLIKAVKCHPYYQELTTNYIDESETEGVYDLYSNGFSTLAIIGVYDEVANPLVESKNFKLIDLINYKLITAILVVFLVVFLVRRLHIGKGEIFEKIRLKTKWFSFEESVRFKFNRRNGKNHHRTD
jgi:hypothetical protein